MKKIKAYVGAGIDNNTRDETAILLEVGEHMYNLTLEEAQMVYTAIKAGLDEYEEKLTKRW